MRPAPGLNKAQQEAYLASVKAFQNRTRPKGPAPSGGGLFDQIGSFMKNNPNKGGGGAGIGAYGRPTNKLPRVPGGPGGPTNTLPRAKMAMGGTVQGQFGTVKPRPTPRPGTNMPLVMNPPSGKPMGKPMGKPGVKMAMGGTVQSRPKGSSPRPGEKPFSPGMPKLPRIKMAMGGTAKAPKKMTLPPGAISGGPYRVPPKVPGGGYTNKPPRLPPGMKPMGMKDGGMAHGTKAKKGRGMAIMIAIGKPKGRGKS